MTPTNTNPNLILINTNLNLIPTNTKVPFLIYILEIHPHQGVDANLKQKGFLQANGISIKPKAEKSNAQTACLRLPCPDFGVLYLLES